VAMAIVCTTCGHQCGDHEDFCPSCGTFLDRAGAARASGAGGGPVPPLPPLVTTAPTQPLPGPLAAGRDDGGFGSLDPNAPEPSVDFGDDVGRRGDAALDTRSLSTAPAPSPQPSPQPSPPPSPPAVPHTTAPAARPPAPPVVGAATQPAPMPAQRPAAVRPQPVEPRGPVAGSVAPTGLTCPSCGTVNAIGEAACRRCGNAFPRPGVGRYEPPGTTQPGAVSPIDAVQPAEAKARRGPDRVEPRGPGVVGGVTCPRCGTANARDRRFCSRCGLPMGPVAAATDTLPPLERRSWWRRFLDRFRRRRFGPEYDSHDPSQRDASERAYKAYRRGVGLRYRLLRITGAIAVIGVVAASLGVGGFNPRGWISDGYHRLRGDQFQAIDGITAEAQPPPSDPQAHPDWATDGVVTADRSWTTTWSEESSGSAACDGSIPKGQAGGALVLTLRATDVARLRIDAGLGADDAARASEWRPTALVVEGDDGSCQRITLDDSADRQERSLEMGTVTSVRVTIVEAVAPLTGDDPALSVREIGLLSER
jgi:hypothetical protein